MNEPAQTPPPDARPKHAKDRKPEPAMNVNLSAEKYEDAQLAAMWYGGALFQGADTRSMLGTGYNKGYLVVRSEDDYLEGDDVVFQNNRGGHTAHRIKAVKPGYVYTQGINNPRGDGWIPITKVKGRVVWPKPQM